MIATELRLGNYVLATWPGTTPPNVRLENGMVLHKVDSGKDIDYAPWYFPIPLTKEWLVKFGFKKPNLRPDENSNYNDDFDFEFVDLCGFNPYLKDGIIIGLCPLEKKWYCLYEGIGSDEGSYLFKLSTLEIKYVHQLQNIYYALTGEELIFNK